LKTNDRPKPHLAAFYLAIVPGALGHSEIVADSRLSKRAISSQMAQRTSRKATMKTMMAREAKNGFGRMIDTARAEPVLIEKQGRGTMMVVSVEE